jgi:hypothetical protein
MCATRAAMPYGILVLALINSLLWLVWLAALGAQIYWISLAVELKPLLSGPTAANARGHNGAAWLSSVVEASRGGAPHTGNRTTNVAP